jgi:hypothetical protein
MSEKIGRSDRSTMSRDGVAEGAMRSGAKDDK